MVSADNSSIPSSTLAPLSKKIYEEVLTSNNISILLFICSYIPKHEFSLQQYDIDHRRNFCMLIQFLLQCPDNKFSEFLSVIADEKYDLPEAVQKKFYTLCYKVVHSEVDFLLNLIKDVGFYLNDLNNYKATSINIHRSSPIGLFLRKMIVFTDKLTFSQSIKVYRLYQQYYQSRNELVTPTDQTSILPIFGSTIYQFDDVNNTNVKNSYSLSSEKSNILSNDTEIHFNNENPFVSPIMSLFDFQPTPATEETYMECILWSRKQTELFLVKQATYLQLNEDLACSPPELHRILNKMMTINPDYSETYFVSYLNCLRVKEFNGALENLIRFFDSVNYEDKAKSYRFAALNLAIFNIKFNNRASAITALKECTNLAHEANDNLCLNIAQAWLRCLNEDENLDSIESTVLKCEKNDLYHIASLSLQIYSRKLLHMGLDGNDIFGLLAKCDFVNSQNQIPDMTLSNIACRSAIWNNYGQLHISSLFSQSLLNMDTTFKIYGLHNYNTEELCTSICFVANMLCCEGKYHLAKKVLNHCRERFPFEYSKWWKMCEQIIYFEQTINSDLWNEAYEAAHRIATIDKYESILRLSELSVEKGDKLEASTQLDKLITSINNDVEGMTNKPYYLLRAYIIGAKAKSGGAAFYILKKALELSITYGYPRYRSLVMIEIAKLQLELGFIKQANELIRKSSVIIFSENRNSERASALVLLAKCHVALFRHLQHNNEQRINAVKWAISKLSVAKRLYKELECSRKVKEVVYLQAILSNEIPLPNERNKYALKFRKLDTERIQSNCSQDFSL